MTIPILDAAAVALQLDNIDVLHVLEDMFMEIAHDRAVQPPQTVTLFPADAGDFITYQGVLSKHAVFGAKLSPYIVQENKPIITAWTCLMSTETGQPLLLCDAGQLTTERTAGTTALAVKHLADTASQKVAIIGAGAIAQAHWRHVANLCDWQEVALWSPSLSVEDPRFEEWRVLCPSINLAESAEQAAADADVVMLCTSSGTPVIDPGCIKAGALVTSISTNVAQAHEVTPGFLLNSQVYCDYRATTPDTAGEMVLAAAEYGWDTSKLIGDLAELVAGQCPTPQRDCPVFFRSVGLGLEDIAMAAALQQSLQN
ncbi:MAG: ornithine cyclodeaminase family protein [Pseudomonadota bacterium]